MSSRSRGRRVVALLVATVAVGGLVGLSPGAAAAAEVGTLTLGPASGTDTSLISFTTHSTSATGCPTGTTNVSAKAFGPGAWAAGLIVLGNTSSGVSTSADFTVPMSDTFNGISQSNAAPIVAGRYDVVLTCRDRLGTTTFGTMTGSVWFTSSTGYQSTDPAGQPAATATSTTLGTSPTSPVASGSPVQLTATVAPSTAAGTVQFSDGATALGTPVAVSGGTATAQVTGLADGSHQLTATFTPTDPTAFAGSASSAVTYTLGTSTPPAVPVLGTLALDPATGLDISAPYMLTTTTGPDKGCPDQTTNLSATVVGPGTWTEPTLVLGNTTNDLSTSADMKVVFADSWNGISQSNNKPIVPGRYDITLLCRNRFGTQKYGVFTGSVWFTDPTHYQSLDPATSATKTVTTIVASPAALTQQGDPVTLTGTVLPATASGSVQFQDTVLGTLVDVGSPVPVRDGTASLVLTTLPLGMHSLAAVFRPADAAKFETSRSDAITFVVSPPNPPSLLRPAVVTGEPRVGSVLTCGAAYAGEVSYSYRWLRSGREISGAAAASRTLTAADLGYRMACRVFATAAGGTAASTSVGTLPVLLGAAPTATKPPRIAGRLVVGRVVQARPGQWTPAVTTYRYQWRRDGRTIARATRADYRIRRIDRGHRLTVVVRTLLAGYAPARTVSPPRRVPNARVGHR